MNASHSARVEALRGAQPLSAILELTYACNWRCVFCFNPRRFDLHRLSAAEWAVVLRDLRDLGGLVVGLTGGEPLAHPEFFEIARSARRLRLAIRLFTNGSLVDDVTAREIAALHPLAVELSLHGATAAVHDAATGKTGSFEALMAGLERLMAHRVRLLLKTPLTRLNDGEVDEMVALAGRLGVRYQIDATLSPRDDGDRGPLAFAASSEAVLGVMRRQSIARTLRPQRRRKGDANCGLGRITVAVDPEGNVYPCHQWRRRALGNVRETRLSSLWPGSAERLAAAAVAVAANDAVLEAGGALSTFDYCPALAYEETGDPLLPDAEVRRRADLAARAFEESA